MSDRYHYHVFGGQRFLSEADCVVIMERIAELERMIDIVRSRSVITHEEYDALRAQIESLTREKEELIIERDDIALHTSMQCADEIKTLRAELDAAYETIRLANLLLDEEELTLGQLDRLTQGVNVAIAASVAARTRPNTEPTP